MALHLKISATSATDNENEDNSLNGKFNYADFLAHKLDQKGEVFGKRKPSG